MPVKASCRVSVNDSCFVKLLSNDGLSYRFPVM
ncbi:MAG: hypothetical protein SCABRO_03388 [Candidatus Scalindua brodae]|uniref:Uncharacterized protein n=1 Tax=Candidatus Scalindua brodae TaxID=237368 RepID=A0A0B0EE34_9BACT|nr:MAG: hypothetical protein SCABRO_03388 [Candidatus Scalindua brodae]